MRREFKEDQERIQKETQLNEEAKAEDEQIDRNFQLKIVNEEYHDVLLSQEFPNFLEERKGLTGVYIGVKDFGVKHINEEDEDEKAHLDTESEKIINYIGYSTSHETIMKGTSSIIKNK